MLKLIGGIKMTTLIVALVIGSILTSIIAVSMSIYFSLHSQALIDGRARQQANIGVAATILEKGIAGSTLEWSESGAIASFQTWSIPTFENNQLIDSVTRVTGQAAAIYALDQATGTLTSRTASLLNDQGKGTVGAELDMGAPAASAVLSGKPYNGLATVAGEAFYAALQPIKGMDGAPLGAIFVGTPIRNIEASANSALALIAIVGSIVTAILGALGFAASHLITRPLPQLALATEAIALGRYDTSVPFTNLGNEIGGMARSIEVFRHNGLRISQLTEAEADRIVLNEQQRQQMMSELQSAFGLVVDAAVAGDFTRKVTTEFPDPELNSLAGGLNRLMTTFDRGATEIGQVLRAMANTDLTQRMSEDYDGAFALIKSDVNAVAEKLSEVVGQLRHTSGSLKTATTEILSGANDLSERTTKQAATIEETSAAMEQLASTVLQNAQRAEDASTNAASVAHTAETGGQVMDAATAAMERITQSSGKISNIIGMIDDIAFQTNLLALNASVEAARAGDAGKGFAVVAVEVRRLAQSAAQASADVKLLVEQSAGDITSGSKLVGEAAGKLKSILGAVQQNSMLLSAIATESREQALAIEHVNNAVRTMDEMTQHNAALVEQTNAAIEQTEAQADELDRIVEIFDIGHSGTPPGAISARIRLVRPRNTAMALRTNTLASSSADSIAAKAKKQI